jgi:hypothetical protein
MKPFLLETQRAFQSRALKQEFTTRKAMQDQIKILLASNFTGDIEPFMWTEQAGYVVDTESLDLLKVQPIPEQQSVLAQLAALFGTLAKLKVMLTDEQKLEVQTLVRSLYELEEMTDEEEYDYEHDSVYQGLQIEVHAGASPSDLSLAILRKAQELVNPSHVLASGEGMFMFHVEHAPTETGNIPEPATVIGATAGFPPVSDDDGDTLKNIQLNTVGWSEQEG